MNRMFRIVFLLSVAASAAGQAKSPSPIESKPAQSSPRKVDRAISYYHYALAHMYEEQVTVYGRSELANKAIEEYRLAIEADPSSEFLTSGLAELYAKTGRIRDAVLEAQDIIKRDPNNLEAHKLLGRIYLRSLGDMPGGNGSDNVLKLAIEQYGKDYKNAIEAYKKAVQLDRDNLDAIRGLAENLLNDGQMDAALDQYKVIVDANPEDAQTYLRIAEIYRKQEKYDLALESLKKAETMVPDSMEVPYNVALVYQAQGRSDEAAKILQDLLKKTEKPDTNYSQSDRSNRAVFIERLGRIYRDQSNYSAAVETFRKMLTLGDESAESGYQEIIDTYREAKQWPQATAAAREGVQKLPNNRDLRMVLDAQLADTGDADKALADVRSLLKGTAEDRPVYVALAQMNTRLKRWADAEAALNKAEQLSTKPEDKQYVAFLRGSTYERQKKYDEAEAEFRKVLAAEPQSAVTLNYLGYMNADRGVRLEESLNYIKQAVSLEPGNGAYLDSLGWAYFRLGKYDLAEENLNKASQHMGSDPSVQEHLGDLYQKTGRLKLAAAHWERALEEWNKTVAAEVDSDAQAKVQQKLDAARVRLAKEQLEKQQ